jgi:hypothetical protein
MGGRGGGAMTNVAPAPHLSAGAPRSRLARARRQIGIIGAYFAQFLKMRMAYRADFLVDLAANLFAIGIQLATLTVLFSKVPSLRGWSFEQVLFIYGFSLLPLGLFNLIASTSTDSLPTTSPTAISIACCCARSIRSHKCSASRSTSPG